LNKIFATERNWFVTLWVCREAGSTK
jgi:hypothetical protein